MGVVVTGVDGAVRPTAAADDLDAGGAVSWALSSITVPRLTLPEVVDVAVAWGYPAVGLWRNLFDASPAPAAARVVEDAGLRVSTVCRAGLFTHAEERSRRHAIEDSCRAVDQAAAVNAAALVVVPGGVVGRDLEGSRAMVRDALGEVAAYAGGAGVRLALEPMHPMLVQARSCITSVGEALDLLDELGCEEHGLTLDSYHVWWDAALATLAPRLAGRAAAVQVADWVDPDDGVTTSRGVPGEGCIDLPRFVGDMLRLGFAGDVEVEVLSRPWWEKGPEATLSATAEGLRAVGAALRRPDPLREGRRSDGNGRGAAGRPSGGSPSQRRP